MARKKLGELKLFIFVFAKLWILGEWVIPKNIVSLAF